jgi:hypothetical protein
MVQANTIYLILSIDQIHPADIVFVVKCHEDDFLANRAYIMYFNTNSRKLGFCLLATNLLHRTRYT